MERSFIIAQIKQELRGTSATEQKNFYHSWWGWMEEGKFCLRSTSGAAQKDLWKFNVPSDGYITFHNSTRSAYCFLRTPPGCPVMKFLYDKGVSYKIIRHHQADEKVLLKGYQQNLHCYYPTARSTVPATYQNFPVILEEGGNGRPTTYWWGQAWTLETSGPWAVIAEEVADHNGLVSKQVAEIHLWAEPMFMSAEVLQSLLKVLQKTLDEAHNLPVSKKAHPCWSQCTEIVDN